MKINNAPLSDFDPNDLKKNITDKITLMIANNLDRWMREVGPDECKRNVNSARTTAASMAQRVLTFISSTEKPLRIRDLAELLLRASVDAEFILIVGDDEKVIRIGENASFLAAISGCANKIIVDLVLQPS